MDAKPMDIRSIPIAEIHVGSRRRPVDVQALTALQTDISERGLRTPIEVSERIEAPGSWLLVAGLHRLTACRNLGNTEIMAVIPPADPSYTSREHELLENLSRVELTTLERCQFLAELKTIFQQKTGAGRGGDQRSGTASEMPQLADWYRSVAVRAGCSSRTIQRQALIGYNLDDRAVEELRGTPFEHVVRELDLLSSQPPLSQVRIVALLTTADDATRAGGVAEAIAQLSGRAAPEQKPVQLKMGELWNRSSAADRRAFVAALKDDELADAVAARGYRLVRV